jgi:hypothetical protein
MAEWGCLAPGWMAWSALEGALDDGGFPATGVVLAAKNQRLAPVAVGLACLGGWPAMILENGLSHEHSPGMTPENAAGQPGQRAGLSPENVERPGS